MADATDVKELAQEIGLAIVGLLTDCQVGETRTKRVDAKDGSRWIVSITRLTDATNPTP